MLRHWQRPQPRSMQPAVLTRARKHQQASATQYHGIGQPKAQQSGDISGIHSQHASTLEGLRGGQMEPPAVPVACSRLLTVTTGAMSDPASAAAMRSWQRLRHQHLCSSLQRTPSASGSSFSSASCWQAPSPALAAAQFLLHNLAVIDGGFACYCVPSCKYMPRVFLSSPQDITCTPTPSTLVADLSHTP